MICDTLYFFLGIMNTKLNDFGNIKSRNTTLRFHKSWDNNFIGFFSTI